MRAIAIGILVLILTGCAGGPPVSVEVPTPLGPFKIMLSSVDELARRVQDGVNDLMQRNNIPVHVSLENNRVMEGDTVKAVETNFYVEPLEAQILFPTGEYTLDKSIGGPHFVASIVEFLNEIEELLPNISLMRLDAVFEGGADKAKEGVKVGKYEGEFDRIEEIAYINGKEKFVELKNNQYITNYELAFLRAYSVYDGFMYLANKRLGSNFCSFQSKIFIAKEYNKVGSKYRFGKVTIKLVEPIDS